MTGRPRVRPITGEQLKDLLIDYAHALGLHVAHFRPMKDHTGRWRTPVGADGKGWPDLVIVGPGGQLFVETKGQQETRTAEQRAWGDWLLASGARYHVWRPSDWDSGAIEAMLRSLRRQPAKQNLPRSAEVDHPT